MPYLFSNYFTFYSTFFQSGPEKCTFFKTYKKFSGWDAQKWYLYCILIRIKCKILVGILERIYLQFHKISSGDNFQSMVLDYELWLGAKCLWPSQNIWTLPAEYRACHMTFCIKIKIYQSKNNNTPKQVQNHLLLCTVSR